MQEQWKANVPSKRNHTKSRQVPRSSEEEETLSLCVLTGPICVCLELGGRYRAKPSQDAQEESEMGELSGRNRGKGVPPKLYDYF